MKEIHLEMRENRKNRIPVHGHMDGTTRMRERTCMNTPVLRLGNNFIRVQYYTRIVRNKNPKLIEVFHVQMYVFSTYTATFR